MSKRRKIFASIAAVVFSFWCILIFGQKPVKAAVSPAMTVDYFVVSKTDYDAYYASFNYTNYITGINAYWTMEKMMPGMGMGTSQWNSMLSTTYADGLSYEDAYDKVFRPDKDPVLKSKKITTLSAGSGVTDIVIVPLVSCDTMDMIGAQVVINVNSFADSAAGSVSVIPLIPTNKTDQTNTSYANNNIQIGWADTGYAGAFRFSPGVSGSLGGIAVKLSSSLSGNIDINMSTDAAIVAQNTFMVAADNTANNLTGYMLSDASSHFTDHAVSISAATPSSDAKVNSITVNGNAVTIPASPATTTIGSNTYKIIEYGDITSPTAGIDIETPTTATVPATVLVTVADSGTYTMPSYGDSIANINDYTPVSDQVDMKKANIGDYLYVRIHTTSNDTTGHEYYLLKILTKKSTKDTITDISLTSSGSSQSSPQNRIENSSKTLVSSGTGFAPTNSNSSTFDYYYAIEDDATTVNVALTFDSTMTVTVNGTAIPAPTPTNPNPSINLTGTDIDNGKIIDVKVTAQNTTNVRHYKFKIRRLSRNLDLDALQIQGASAGGNANYGSFDVTTQTYSFTSGELPVPYVTTSVSVATATTPASTTGAQSTVKVYAGLSANPTTAGNTVTYSTTVGGAAQTAYFIVEIKDDLYDIVSAADKPNHIKKHTINVDRAEADNTVELDTAATTATGEISYYDWGSRSWSTQGDTANTTENITAGTYASTSNSHQFTTLSYGARYVTVYLVPKEPTTKYYSDSARTIEITNTNKTYDLFSTTPTAAGASPSIVVYAKTEAGNATLNLKFPYAAADINSNATYQIRAYNTTTNSYDMIPPSGTAGNTSTFVFDTTKYTNGKYEIVNVSTSKPTTTLFTSSSNANYNALTAHQYDASDQYNIDINTPIYLTAVSQAQGTYYTTYIIKSLTLEDQDNKISNIVIKNTTDPTSVVTIPFTFVNTVTDYTVQDGGTTTATTGYAVYVDFDVTQVQFDVTKNSANSSFIVGNSFLGNNPLNAPTISNPNPAKTRFEFQLKSKDGTPGTKYTIDVYRRDGEHDQYMESASINTDNLYVGSNGTTILDNYTRNSTSMDYILARGNNVASLSFTVSNKASYTIVDGTASPVQTNTNFNINVPDGSYKLVTVYVFSEYNKTLYPGNLSYATAYKIYVFCADQDYKINDINLLSNAGTNAGNDVVSTSNGTFNYVPTTLDYTSTTFEVPYKDNATIDLEVKRNALTSYISGNITMSGASYVDPVSGIADTDGKSPVSVSTTATPITIKVQSEYAYLKNLISTYTGQTSTYKIKIKRAAASTVNTLDTITITIGSLVFNIPADGVTTYEYDDATGSTTTSGTVVLNSDSSISASNTFYIKGIETSATQAVVSAQATDPLSTVSGDTGMVPIDLVSNATCSIKIKVTPESAGSGTTGQSTYTIYVSRAGVQFDGVCDISNVFMTDGSAKEYMDGTSYQFVITQPSYGSATNPIEIPASQTAITFNIAKVATTAKTYEVASGSNVLLTNDRKVFNNLTEGALNKFEFFCKSLDGTESIKYTVYFKRLSYNSDARLKSLTVNGTSVKTDPFNPTTSFDMDVFNYSVYVNESVTDVTIVGVPNAATSTIQSNDAATAQTLNEGANTFVIVVQSENPAVTKPYTVTVYKDTKNTLTDLKVLDDASSNLITYSQSQDEYTGITVSFSNTTATFVYTLEGDASLLTVELYKDVAGVETKITSPAAAQTLQSGLNRYLLKVITQSKVTKTYKVEITREAGKSDAYILTYETEAGEQLNMLTSQFKYSYIVPTSVNTFNPTFTYSDGATIKYQPTSTIITAGTKTRFQISIQSEDLSVTNDYYFDVYCASTDFEIVDIKALLTQGGNNVVDALDTTKYVQFDRPTQKFATGDTDYTYTLNVAYSVSDFYLDTTLNSLSAVLMINGSQSNNQIHSLSSTAPTTFKIQAYSQYATIVGAPDAENYKSKEYTITIVREAANQNVDLKELSVLIGTKTYNLIVNETIQSDPSFQANGTLFTIEDVEDTATLIRASAEPVKPNPQTTLVASFENSTLNNQVYTYTNSLATYNETAGTGYNFTFTIVVKGEGENPPSKTYTINVSRGKFNVAEYNELEYITVVAEGVEYFGKSEFIPGNAGPYTVTIPFIASSSYTINAYIPAITKASGETVYIDNVVTSSGNKVVSFTYPTTGDYKKSHTVYGANSKLESGTVYQLNIIISAPSTDTSLAELSIDGNNIISNFTATSDTYTYPTKFANDVPSVIVRATASSTLATVTISRMNNTSATTGVATALGVRTIKEGTQTVTVTVTAQNGQQDSYNVILNKSFPVPYLFNLEVAGEQLLDVNNIATTFEEKTLQYHVTVPYMTVSATINASLAATNSNCMVTCGSDITSSGTVRSFPVALSEGTNPYNITVISPEGDSTTYNLIIQRRGIASTNTRITNFFMKARETSEVIMDNDDYNNSTYIYGYTVPNNVRNVDVTLYDSATANADGAKYQVLNNTDLKVGNNQVIILVTAEDGETSRAVVVNVEREPNEFDIAIKEIEPYRTDFEKETLKDSYTVPSNVSALNFTVKDRVTNKDITFDVSGGSNLKVGENIVKVTMTAADGTVAVQEVKVIRDKMSFEVDKKAYEYVCTEAANAAQINTATDMYYTIDLKDKKATEISDYTKYIINLSDGATAKVISNPDNNSSEVIVKVSNSDETEVQYVHFQIQTTANQGSMFDILFWIILGITIVLLTAILICVNRDKYGSVSKRRKNA